MIRLKVFVKKMEKKYGSQHTPHNFLSPGNIKIAPTKRFLSHFMPASRDITVFSPLPRRQFSGNTNCSISVRSQACKLIYGLDPSIIKDLSARLYPTRQRSQFLQQKSLISPWVRTALSEALLLWTVLVKV